MARSEREESKGFRYQKRTREDMKARANMRGGGFDTYIKPEFKMYKVRDGKNLIRILPPTWKDAKHYGYDIWLNYGIGADNQTYLSLSKMLDEKDPLAEARREADREGDKDTSRALQPRQRLMMWIIDRNEEDEGPQLWAAPFSVDKDVINLCLDEDTKEVLYIDDPKEGQDLRFYKEGTGIGTKYPASRMKLLEPGPVHEDRDIRDEWLAFVEENPIPDTLNYYDADHIAAAFDGTVRKPDDDDDKPAKKRRDDDDEKPRKSKSRDDEDDDPKPKRARAKLDEDEDDEKPARKKSSRDDDEEPEEKPKAKARSRHDDDDEKPARKKAADDDEVEDADDEEDKPRESIRDRLKKRRESSKSKSDDDDD